MIPTQVPSQRNDSTAAVLKAALCLQDLFYGDDSVLFIDIHQAEVWPGSGHVNESGQDAGDGYTVNVPLPGQPHILSLRVSGWRRSSSHQNTTGLRLGFMP